MPTICFKVDSNLKRRIDRWWIKVQKEYPEESISYPKDKRLADFLEEGFDNYEPY